MYVNTLKDEIVHLNELIAEIEHLKRRFNYSGSVTYTRFSSNGCRDIDD